MEFDPAGLGNGLYERFCDIVGRPSQAMLGEVRELSGNGRCQ
jgi:hypothetical protein